MHVVHHVYATQMVVDPLRRGYHVSCRSASPLIMMCVFITSMFLFNNIYMKPLYAVAHVSE